MAMPKGTKFKFETAENPDEIWYSVPQFPGYEFSSDQRMRSFRKQTGGFSENRWKILKLQVDRDGHHYYTLRRDDKSHRKFVHHIVAMLAYGDVPSGLLVLHFDDNKENNHASNLSYGTHADNANDMSRNGNSLIGTRHPLSKLDEDDIREVRHRAACGFSQRSTARRFKVSQCLIHNIVSRKTWSHIA